jgi:predicted GTPase
MEDIHKQDQQIAQEILKLGKGLVIAANKIDEYHAREQGDLEESDKKLRDYLSYHFQFLWMSPVFLVSAKTGEGVGELLDAIKPIFDTRHRVAAQESLDAMLAAQGMTKQDYINEVRLQKLLQKMVGEVKVTDAEIEKFMATNQQMMTEETNKEELKKNLRQSLEQEKLNQEYQKFIENLKKSAKINYFVTY